MSACSFSTLKLDMVLTHGIPPDVHGGVHIFLPSHTIGSVPSLSGHAITHRWRSLPRVRWPRASSPQGSSSNGCCLCITMDQLFVGNGQKREYLVLFWPKTDVPENNSGRECCWPYLIGQHPLSPVFGQKRPGTPGNLLVQRTLVRKTNSTGSRLVIPTMKASMVPP